MKFERFKSILLIMLVISSIVLTGNKWFNEELWPGGYNFFSDVKNFFGAEKDKITFNPNEEILRPAEIIINSSGNHTLYTKSSDKYSDLYSEIKAVLESGINAENFEEVDVDEWDGNLQSKSCYFSYPVTYDSGYFSSQLSKKYSGGFECFREFMITTDLRISSVSYLYIKDAQSNSIQKTKINLDIPKISEMTNNSSYDGDNSNYYSFELNFDSNDENFIDQPIVIDPDVLISISGKNMPEIKENSLFSNISENNEMYGKFLTAFGFNPSNIRKYVESDNSIVFVENYSTLKLHTNDMLEYKPVESGDGIMLDTSSINSCLNSCITFVNTVTKNLNFPPEMYYEISSDIKNVSSKTFTMTFDYYLNDNQIVISDTLYPISNAVQVEVVNGKITGYKQLCKTFEASGSYVYCISAIEAIDMIAPDNQTLERVSDIFPAYSYDSAHKKWAPVWYVENSDGKLLTITSS